MKEIEERRIMHKQVTAIRMMELEWLVMDWELGAFITQVENAYNEIQIAKNHKVYVNLPIREIEDVLKKVKFARYEIKRAIRGQTKLREDLYQAIENRRNEFTNNIKPKKAVRKKSAARSTKQKSR